MIPIWPNFNSHNKKKATRLDSSRRFSALYLCGWTAESRIRVRVLFVWLNCWKSRSCSRFICVAERLKVAFVFALYLYGWTAESRVRVRVLFVWLKCWKSRSCSCFICVAELLKVAFMFALYLYGRTAESRIRVRALFVWLNCWKSRSCSRFIYMAELLRSRVRVCALYKRSNVLTKYP